jgi:LacI family transcriptional regulator
MTVIYISGPKTGQNLQKINGIAAYAKRKDWNFQTVEIIGSLKELNALSDLWHPDGYIANCSVEVIRKVFRNFRDVPTVLFEYPRLNDDRRVAYISSDVEETAKLAAKALLTLGLANYGYANWHRETPWNTARRESFRRIILQHGKSIHTFSTTEETTAQTVRRLAAQIDKLPKPIGIFAVNDIVAEKIVSACQLIGANIPNDVAILGVDNSVELCERSSPTISSIDLDHEKSGWMAAELLDQLMQNQTAKVCNRHYPPTGVIHRESLRRFNIFNSVISNAVERIRKEACNGLTADDVLKRLPWSRRHSEKLFRTITGKGIHEEILNVRLENAKDMLKNQILSIEHIAHRSGYATLHAFSVFFKSKTGMSPMTWRKRT